MYSVNSYQDIKTPEELEEERNYETELNSMYDEYDSDMGCSYEQYKRYCRKLLNDKRRNKEDCD